MAKQTARGMPRPFALHWGSGHVVEEATYAGQHHEPSLQLLEFDDGYLSVRFCDYDHAGRFQRSPLSVSKDEVAGLKKALAGAPRLRALLREMVS